MEEEIWKFHPDMPNLEVSSFGRVKINNLEKKGYLNKNGYRSVRTNNKNYRIHRLVAQAFIPNPENKPDINHINGIKHDNRVKNLEWCTQRENVMHALENNLRKDRYPISILNIESKEITNFKLLKDCARFLGVSQDAILSKIKSSERFPLNGKYTLLVDSDFINRIKHPLRNNNIPIFCYDHVSNKFLKFISAAEMAYETRMNSYTVREACSKKVDVYYIGGYSFSYMQDFKIENRNKFTALRERLRIYKKPIPEINKIIDVFDYRHNKIIASGSCQELEPFFKLTSSKISNAASSFYRYGKNVLLKGYGVKYRDCPVGWYPYSEKEVMNSMLGNRPYGVLYKITDNQGRTSYGTGMESLSLMFTNVSIETLKGWVSKNPEKIKNYFPGVKIEIL